MNIDLGRIKEARQQLEASLPDALHADDLQTTVTHLGQLVRVYAATGQAAEAAKTAASLLGNVARRPYPSADCIMPLLFACRWVAGQGATVISEQGPICLSHLERLDAELHTGQSQAALAEARACLSLAAGRPRAAAEHLRLAVAGWETTERCYDQASALAALARALGAARDTVGARDAGARALDAVETLAAQLDEELRASFRTSPLVQEIRQALGTRANAARSSTSRRAVAGLTEREIEVLRLVAQGLTNVQIASSLVVSPLTVNSHLRSIFNKLDVTRRAAAVRFAVEHGLV